MVLWRVLRVYCSTAIHELARGVRSQLSGLIRWVACWVVPGGAGAACRQQQWRPTRGCLQAAVEASNRPPKRGVSRWQQMPPTCSAAVVRGVGAKVEARCVDPLLPHGCAVLC